jgi:predicted Abi (CAAX) family protease
MADMQIADDTKVAAGKSNYAHYRASDWVHPEHYPLDKPVDPARYRPVAAWIGRLILPERAERRRLKGVWFEVQHAPADHERLVGRRVVLRWSDERDAQARVWSVARDVIFSEPARKSLVDGFLILPERLNGWRLVEPLESLAGARPVDDVVVGLAGPVSVIDDQPDGDAPPALLISRAPVQISGRFYGLVSFVGPLEPDGDAFRVLHFNRASGQFDGGDEVVRLPAALANSEGIFPSVAAGIERSPLNGDGWYIYGAKDRDGCFIVQALAPRALLRLRPERVLFGEEAAWRYIRHEAWRDPAAHKGTIGSVLLAPSGDDPAAAVADWREGDRALLLHNYSGIGGKKREAAARSGLYFGHFAFGLVDVVREPLADELIFDIVYHQIYTHNVDGLIAGGHAWARYMGDRQWGWAGSRPVCDLIVKLDALADEYAVDGVPVSALDVVANHLELMAARYRIGDGRGVTFVGAANNCAQDSCQALYGALRRIGALIESQPEQAAWRREHPAQAARLGQVERLSTDLRRRLGGSGRADWDYQAPTLGLSESAFTTLRRGLRSWRAVLPRKASDTVVRECLRHGAAVWVLRTNQIGGDDPDIAPIAPMTF